MAKVVVVRFFETDDRLRSYRAISPMQSDSAHSDNQEEIISVLVTVNIFLLGDMKVVEKFLVIGNISSERCKTNLETKFGNSEIFC